MLSHLNALVLNADLRPVRRYPLSTWSCQDTARKVMTGSAVPLAYYDAVLRSPTTEYIPPSVVMLRSYVRRHNRVPFTRRNVFLRDGFRCQYCGEAFEAHELTFDHVIPRAAGGRTNWGNIVSACVPCNSGKGHRRDIHPIQPPREPTSEEMGQLRKLKSETFHESWFDYLYWSGALETD